MTPITQRALPRAVYAVMVVAALLASPAVAQQSNEQLGREIATEADRRDLGWRDNASVMRMILRNRNGDESVRELRRQVLETNEEGAGDKSLLTFDAPRDVRALRCCRTRRSSTPTTNGSSCRRSRG